MKKLLFISALTLILLGCRKQEPIYGVNNVDLDLIETSKTKLKTPNQFVAILYANLFQTALPVNKLVEITDLIDAIGDDQVAYEIIISNFMNMSTVQIPSNTDMRANPEHFIIETYKRFLIRRPTEAEKTYFINRINTNQNITAELVYFSFALSDEYQYY